MVVACVLVGMLASGLSSQVRGQSTAADPLPSWRDGTARQAIIAFIERVTKDGGPEFVPAYERVAVFDNDGTLWSERRCTSSSPTPSIA